MARTSLRTNPVNSVSGTDFAHFRVRETLRESTLSTWTLPRYPSRINLKSWIPNWIPADFLSVSNLAKPDIGKRYGSSSGRTWPARSLLTIVKVRHRREMCRYLSEIALCDLGRVSLATRTNVIAAQTWLRLALCMIGSWLDDRQRYM